MLLEHRGYMVKQEGRLPTIEYMDLAKHFPIKIKEIAKAYLGTSVHAHFNTSCNPCPFVRFEWDKGGIFLARLSNKVSLNQSAFVLGRRISDNILLSQELMHNYHLDRGPARCAFKVDIQKAYDTVDWGFLKGKRGLCQCDPMSPYLFTLVMEVLMLILQRKVEASDSFTYHHYCSKLNIINLCFADDLFLFVHGDVNLAKVIMEALDEFKLVSGLVPSLPKSTSYFCNVLNYVKLAILNIIPFEEVFILPSRIMCDLEQLMRGFLWCHGDMLRGKAKVAWEVACLPKKEGGLGVRRLDVFNKALIASHIWSILTSKESLWVKWIHGYKLRDRNFWDTLYRGAGFKLFHSVKDGILNGNWAWTIDWCDFSFQVWDHLNTFAGLPNSSASLDSIVDMLIPISKKKSARSVTAKLVFAASSYFIWQERNSKIFKNKRRCKDQLIEVIMTTVRLKLLTCRFKRTASVEYFFSFGSWLVWNIFSALEVTYLAHSFILLMDLALLDCYSFSGSLARASLVL
ncbi:hypothetical protein Tco_0892398 [Tanacetum coccineum]|uniref:Reverse transcriptase domain-containing protein n=1 Tax=Tanacetum coccineum TaxID=301880 RepID=A0ABQ5C5R7_9ASTR